MQNCLRTEAPQGCQSMEASGLRSKYVEAKKLRVRITLVNCVLQGSSARKSEGSWARPYNRFQKSSPFFFNEPKVV